MSASVEQPHGYKAEQLHANSVDWLRMYDPFSAPILATRPGRTCVGLPNPGRRWFEVGQAADVVWSAQVRAWFFGCNLRRDVGRAG